MMDGPSEDQRHPPETEDYNDINQPPAKKRRTPKACHSCRLSKLKCDENRPCSRCVNAGTECVFYLAPKDPIVARVEQLEDGLNTVRSYLAYQNNGTGHLTSPSASSHRHVIENRSVSTSSPQTATHGSRSGEDVSMFRIELRQPESQDLLSSSALTEEEAKDFFHAFFQGCHKFVPIFDPLRDRYDIVKRGSIVLFDVIVILGCRAACGATSRQFELLYPYLRRRTSDLVHVLTSADHMKPNVDLVRALVAVASYAESGSILIDVAIQAALRCELPRAVDGYMYQVGRQADGSLFPLEEHSQILTACRTWHAIYVLDSIFSLEGGKHPAISLLLDPLRLRVLLKSPATTAQDLRLLAQVELNNLRASSYKAISSLRITTFDEAAEQSIQRQIAGHLIDLDIWLSAWLNIVNTDQRWPSDQAILTKNIETQHAWAVLAIHLHALSCSGIDNIALMLPSQRIIASNAKAAAERHLGLALQGGSYIADFKYAMDFVWAKNAFCVLITLRLSILLGDSIVHLKQRLQRGQAFMQELVANGHGNAGYCQILATILEKCSRALDELDRPRGPPTALSPADEFQAFNPKEFQFDWDFPGLHLRYVPLDWQDFLVDFNSVA